VRSQRRRLESPGVLLAALVFGLLMSASIAANIWLEGDLAAQADSLEVTRGTVSSCDVRREARRGRASSRQGTPRGSTSSVSEYSFVVQYTVRGRPHTVHATGGAVEGHEEDSPEALARAFPVGATLPVYYHPGEPAIAFLARPGGAARSGEVTVWWFGLALSLAFCVGVVARAVRHA
jgi:hypothetical protein